MMTESFPFAFTVNANRVVDKDEAILVEPDQAGLRAIARAYDLAGIKKLEAQLTLKPYRKEGLRVVGQIRADITQTCVVSLETFDSNLTVNIDRTFEPASSRPRKARDLNADGEIEIDLESLDPPDAIVDGVLDIGAVICEELALSLDPFPRKPGVEFEGGREEEHANVEETEERPSPFAALEALKSQKED